MIETRHQTTNLQLVDPKIQRAPTTKTTLNQIRWQPRLAGPPRIPLLYGDYTPSDVSFSLDSWICALAGARYGSSSRGGSVTLTPSRSQSLAPVPTLSPTRRTVHNQVVIALLLAISCFVFSVIEKKKQTKKTTLYRYPCRQRSQIPSSSPNHTGSPSFVPNQSLPYPYPPSLPVLHSVPPMQLSFFLSMNGVRMFRNTMVNQLDQRHRCLIRSIPAP